MMATSPPGISSADLSARRQAVAELGTAMRGAVAALCVSEVSVEHLRRAARLADEIRGLLSGASRTVPDLPSVDDMPTLTRYFNPVVGLGTPISPPLDIVDTAEGVVARATLDGRFEGPSGYVHGGVTGLLLDEVLGRALIRTQGWGMTASLSMIYRRAVPLNVELEFSARIDAVDGRKTRVVGGIAIASDPETMLVEAEGMFVAPRQETLDGYFGGLVGADGVEYARRFGRPSTTAS